MSDHWMIDEIKASARENQQQRREKKKQDELRDQIAKVDAKSLSKMSDVQLASWQSEYPDPSPQHTLANFEWQRRLTVIQVRSARFAAWLGLLGVVVGAALAWVFSHYFSR